MKLSRKSTLFLLTFTIAISSIFTQETLKSTEEEYYDYLSLTGTVIRPTLGYRTLSDSEWNFVESTETVTNEDGTTSEKTTTTFDSSMNVWKNNNLGNKYLIAGNENLKWKIYGPSWYNSYNTAAPYGQNDGALWQGVGYNTSFTAGARFEAYGVELTVKPVVCFSQNAEFEYLPGVYSSEYSYFTNTSNIDLVQRYGDSSFWTFDWGDTEIRYTWETITLGLGTQSPWLGSAWLNPMLGSNNAATYPKIDAGIRKTKVIIPLLNWNLGYIEGRIWTGYLHESEYFDSNDTNNENMLNALSASYSPSFIPGLIIGLNRVFVTKWKTENLQYLGRLFTLSRSNATETGNDEDQKFSIFVDWLFSKIGFEIYGEFGRDDFSSNEYANPFHTAIYTVGLKQNIPLPINNLFPKLKKQLNLKSEFILEWNNFEMSQDFQLQWPYLGYYSHGAILQGYTNYGQIIGAGSGEFGNSQFIGYKLYYSKGSTMLFFHRYCPDNNWIYSKAVNASSNNADSEIGRYWYSDFETFFVFGVDTSFYITNNCYLTAEFDYINIYNFNYYINTQKNTFSIHVAMKYNF